jgi:hypothetical protein
MVKGQHGNAADRDRVYIDVDGETRRLAVHVVHDLPHLVVESFFGITDGLWGELKAGFHPEANFAATARDPKRQKQGRFVSGAASAARTEGWLTEGHRMAKIVTNAVVNRWGDGPDTPAGVRSRLRGEASEPIRSLLGRADDETIAVSIQAVRVPERRWASMPPGGTLRLCWPLEPSDLA